MKALRIAVLAAVTPLATSVALASPTATWTVDSYTDFDKGESKSALISSQGAIRPGFKATRVPTEFSDSWSMLAGASGELFIGTADKGTIYRVRGDKAKKFATLPGVVAVVSLAQNQAGNLFAGTMPDGQVWRIDANGKAKKLASLKGAESVWALSVVKSGALYAGTGPQGKLFRVDTASGKATVAYETGDKRITATMAAKDGSVWFGTSESALVFRHDPVRKSTRAMGDFAGNEISAIAEWNGSAIVAANDLKEPSTSGVKTKSAVAKAKGGDKPGVKPKSPKEKTTPGSDPTTPSAAVPPRKGARKGKGALFRIRGDGQLTQLHALTSTYFTDIAVDPSGGIYAGAGDKGRIYLIEDEDNVSTVFDVNQRVIAQIAFVKGRGLMFSTADSSALYKSEGATKNGHYLSDSFDAKAAARFGTMRWRGTSVKVDTRTGNTAKPGKGWSKWQSPSGISKQPVSVFSGKVTSPPGRYLQFRVRFASDKASLEQTQLYYLAQNRSTKIKKISVKLPARKGKKLVTVKPTAKPRSPEVEVSWAVTNDDGDETTYRVDVRRDGEVRWRSVLKNKQPITETKVKWNTETFPDGHYRLRVTTSDRRANPKSSRQESRKTTGFFVLDNQKPKLDGLTVRYPAASARASDSLSAIAEAAYSVDDGPWVVAGASDGLFDDMSEILQLELPARLSSGVHTLALRVADEAGNIAAASVSFRIK